MVLLNNIYYDTGETSQDEHNAVGDHYGVPHVSIRDSIYKDLHAGKYASRTLLSPDGLHPNDYGHGLVAGEIIKLLEARYRAKVCARYRVFLANRYIVP